MSNRFPNAYLLLAISVIVLSAGCGGDDPVSSQEEHFEAEGLVLVDSGVRFFRYFQGVIDTTGGQRDHLEAPLGLTGHWNIKFLDENGNEIDAPEGGEQTFGWTIGDATLLEVFQDAGDEG